MTREEAKKLLDEYVLTHTKEESYDDEYFNYLLDIIEEDKEC